MRAILSKAVAVSMIAGAGLLVTACNTETTTLVNNTTEIEVPAENISVSDEMVTNIDGAAGNVVEANVTEANATVGNEM